MRNSLVISDELLGLIGKGKLRMLEIRIARVEEGVSAEREND